MVVAQTRLGEAGDSAENKGRAEQERQQANQHLSEESANSMKAAADAKELDEAKGSRNPWPKRDRLEDPQFKRRFGCGDVGGQRIVRLLSRKTFVVREKGRSDTLLRTGKTPLKSGGSGSLDEAVAGVRSMKVA